MNQARQIHLPPPDRKGGMALEATINRRKSIREFSPQPLSLEQLSQLLWAAQGRSDTSRRRTVPSAGATYPLELFVACGDNGVPQVKGGTYHYDIENHALTLHYAGDVRQELAHAALGQECIYEAPLDIAICTIYERTIPRYGSRGERYVHIEVGHAGQNIYLQATALGLGTVAIGAFHDESVRAALRLDKSYRPLYIMPVGKPA